MCEPQAGEAESEHKHTHMHIYTHIHLSYIHVHNRDMLTKYTCTLVIHTNTTYAYKAHVQIHITRIDTENTRVHIHPTYIQRFTGACTIHTDTHTCCVNLGLIL